MRLAEKIVRQAARRTAWKTERALRETAFALGLLGIPFDRSDLSVQVWWEHLDCGPVSGPGARFEVAVRWRPGSRGRIPENV